MRQNRILEIKLRGGSFTEAAFSLAFMARPGNSGSVARPERCHHR
jgi:hypothetical protein